MRLSWLHRMPTGSILWTQKPLYFPCFSEGGLTRPVSLAYLSRPAVHSAKQPVSPAVSLAARKGLSEFWSFCLDAGKHLPGWDQRLPPFIAMAQLHASYRRKKEILKSAPVRACLT